MKLINQDRIEEFMLVLNENISSLSRIWLYILGIVIIASVPLFFIFKTVFFQAFTNGYVVPVVTPHKPELEPLQVIDKKIFRLDENIYSGYVKLKNINLDWGIREQEYSAVFKTLGGSAQVSGKTFILPASEKLIVFSRFSSDREPSDIEFGLSESRYILKPSIPSPQLEISRVEIQNSSDEFLVSALVKNLTAFTVTQIHLPVVLYNNRNEVVGVNFTSINDVKSGEARSFQVVWPNRVESAVRAEVFPQVNIFEPNVYETEPGRSPFNSFERVEVNQ